MKRIFSFRTMLAAFALALTSLVSAPMASAGDPQIDAAISRQVVGEQVDGYLGFVRISDAEPSLKRKVDEINAKRRALYQKLASETGVSPAQVARVTGEKQIRKSSPGDLVLDTTGRWVSAKDADLGQ